MHFLQLNEAVASRVLFYLSSYPGRTDGANLINAKQVKYEIDHVCK